MYGFADRVGQEGGHIPEGELSQIAYRLVIEMVLKFNTNFIESRIAL